MITNRHQKKQSNISCIPDGNVHAFHHKIFYLALKEFERESFFSGKCASSQRSLSQSLIVCRAGNITLTFCVLSCLVSLGLLGLLGLMGLLGKKETHET